MARASAQASMLQQRVNGDHPITKPTRPSTDCKSSKNENDSFAEEP